MKIRTDSPMTSNTRRASARREVCLPCQAVRESDFRLVAERTLDVSTYGMLLRGARSVAVGESIIVSFFIPGMWIDAEATVARVVHGRRPSDEGPAFGVIFDRMGAPMRAALAGYLHGRPPPLPRRGPLARMRRGEAMPVLADEAIMLGMQAPLTGTSPTVVLASEEDVVSDDAIDAFAVLREMAAAWASLAC